MTEQETLQELAGTWALLQRPESKQIRSSHTNLSIGGRSVHVGVDRFGAKHLLLPHMDAPGDANIWRSRSLKLTRSNFTGVDGAHRTWLLLRCNKPDAEDAYLRLCAQIVRRLSEADSSVIVAQTVSILDEWQDLFGGYGSGASSLIGIIGELLLLKRLARVDPVYALRAWEGPRGGRHDFRNGAAALEVKTTGNSTARIVSVSGIAQLATPADGSLHLLFTRLERVPGGSITLPSLVDQLAELGISRTELLEILEDSGYNVDRDTASFELQETCLYKVDENFPKLLKSSFVAGDVPMGISSVSYSVDLNCAVPLPAKAMDPILDSLATE